MNTHIMELTRENEQTVALLQEAQSEIQTLKEKCAQIDQISV